MTLPDNRIRFPAGKIDLDTDVGATGQDHDTYPTAGTQARADWMNIAIIGLLSQQSSYSEPTQYRDGTPWFDLTTSELKIRFNNEWVSFADVVHLKVSGEETGVSLTDWYNDVYQSVDNAFPDITFSGTVTSTTTTSITIPTSLRTYLTTTSRAFVYQNGLLLDPRLCTLTPSGSPTSIIVPTLESGDKFTVVIRRIASTYFYSPEVII